MPLVLLRLQALRNALLPQRLCLVLALTPASTLVLAQPRLVALLVMLLLLLGSLLLVALQASKVLRQLWRLQHLGITVEAVALVCCPQDRGCQHQMR